MTTTTARGLTKAEYEAMRAEFKSALGFKVNLQRATAKYAAGAVSIRPTREARLFTVEQVEAIRSMLIAKGFYCTGLADYTAYVFQQGFGYMRKLIS